MGFRTGAYATVWEIKQGNGNYTDVRISTSKKDRGTDKYVTDFSGYVRLVGEAHQSASNLQEKDRIKIGDCEVTNNYNKEKNTTYVNYAIFGYEDVSSIGDSTSGTKNESTKATAVSAESNDDDDLPF